MPPTIARPSLLPSTSAICRPSSSSLPSAIHRPTHYHQIRHATLIPRPHRPYTFTQLMTLSDGSTFLHRTTSPSPVYKSTRDTRNTPLWNPSNQKLANVEEDEAGRLRAFRKRFGRGWDAETKPEVLAEGNQEAELERQRGDRKEMDGKGREEEEEEDNLMDLISGAGVGQRELVGTVKKGRKP